MKIPTLQAVLGHSSLRMVSRYVHPTQDHMDAEMVIISKPAETSNDVKKSQAAALEINLKNGAKLERSSFLFATCVTRTHFEQLSAKED